MCNNFYLKLIPERFFRPSANNSGCSRGNWTVSNMSFLILARPPISSQETAGMEGAPMLAEYDARDSSKALFRSSNVSVIPAWIRSFSVTLESLHISNRYM